MQISLNPLKHFVPSITRGRRDAISPSSFIQNKIQAFSEKIIMIICQEYSMMYYSEGISTA